VEGECIRSPQREPIDLRWDNARYSSFVMSSEVETSLSIEQQNNESLRSLPLLVLSSGARSPTGVPVATALCRRVCARDASTERGGYKPLDRSCLLSSSIGRITGLAVCAATMLAM